MRIITVILLLAYSSLSIAENATDEYFCNINALKTIDYSADIAGYYQDDYSKVFPEWLSKAKVGNKKYQFYIAETYQYGQGVKQNKQKALEWYIKSSDQGYPLAKNNLSHFHYNGEIVDQNFANYFKLLCEAATAGFSMSTNGIANFYFDIDTDKNRSYEWTIKAAKQGSAAAQNNLGWMYGTGNGVDLDYNEAFKWYRKSADQGDDWGQFNLALMYMDGRGVSSDYFIAHDWYKKSANQGHTGAFNNLGLDYKTGLMYGDSKGNIIKSDYREAVKWLDKGIEFGCATCASMLYEIYIEKNNINADPVYLNKLYNPKLAVESLELGDEMGYEMAPSMLGSIYLTGDESIEQDLKKALFWFHKSEEKYQDSFSQGQLSFLYSSATGRADIRDDVASVYWAKKASDQQNIQGKTNLASSYEWGEGVGQDGNFAIKTYKEIVELGNSEEAIGALKNIGFIYSMGLTNVTINFDTAIDFYKQAEAMGDKESQYFLGRIFLSLGDYVKAKKWFIKSGSDDSNIAIKYLNNALNDNAESQLQIGHIVSVFGNTKASYYWFEMAAKNGNAEAQNIIGSSFGGTDNSSFGETKNDDISLYWVKKSAQQGDAMAQNNLGVAYHNGAGVNKDIDQAIYWYSLSADQGYGIAFRNLGSISLTIDKDSNAAIDYFEKAFENKAFPAAWDLGLVYLNGKNGIKINKELAFEWFMKAANKFYKPAEFKISMMLLSGDGVEIDENMSTIWLIKAFNNNVSRHDVEVDELVRRELAWRFFNGIGVERSLKKAKETDLSYAIDLLGDCSLNPCSVDDYVMLANAYQYELNNQNKALIWWKKAADEGNVYSQRMLGMLYSLWSESAGIKSDFEQAEYWFLKAIQSGDLDSMTNLARVYYSPDENPGVPSSIFNPSKSFDLLIEAQESGSTNYYDGLIYLYSYGIGVEKNIEEALLLLDQKMNNLEEYEKDYWFNRLFWINVENNTSDDDAISKSMNFFINKAKLGDVKGSLSLVKMYLHKGFEHYDEKEAIYWLKQINNKSIKANLILSDFSDNYEEYGQNLINAIELYENNSYEDYIGDQEIIDTYNEAANYYLQIGVPETAEKLLRTASRKLITGDENSLNQYIKITMAGMSDDYENSVSYLENFINVGINNRFDIEANYYLTFHAFLTLHDKYLSEKEIIKAQKLALFALNLVTQMEKETQDPEYFTSSKKTVLLLVVRNFIQTNQMDLAKEYFSLYKEDSSNIKAEAASNDSIGIMVDSIWENIIDSIIKVDHGEIEAGFQQLKNTLNQVNDSDTPLRTHDLDLALIPMNFFAMNGEYQKASILMSKVIDLYKSGVELRIKNNSLIKKDEKEKIKNVIAEYISLSKKGGIELKDKGFNVMQLASGLTLSDTVIKSISTKQLSGNDYIKSKLRDSMISQRRALIDQKFANLSSDTEKLKTINSNLNLLDEKINSLDQDLGNSKQSTFEAFITPAEEVQKNLSTEDALITMLLSGDRSFIWLITKEGVFRHDSKMSSYEISLHANNLRLALNPSNQDNISFPFKSSSKLYDLLIAPFEKELRNIDRLIFAPAPALSQIPFSILTKPGSNKFKVVGNVNDLRGVKKVTSKSKNSQDDSELGNINWLIQDYSIAVVPSVYSYVGLEKESKNQKNSLDRFIGIGNPLLSGNEVVLRGLEQYELADQRGAISKTLKDLSALPETEKELNTIAKYFNSSEIITQNNATETKVRNMDLSVFNVIAFATHALVSNEIDDLFEPAIVLTPIDSDNPENDGLLMASEVAKLNLNADIVLLSACNTASSFDESNSQGLSGLADSFFAAGAKSILASYWSVISDSAVDITTRMFDDSNTGKSYSHKHRESVLKILAEPNSYKSNPVYWAPFMVVGVN